MGWTEELESTRDKLNSVSSSFCLAKWLQVTIHLQNGFNHSCHHPQLHQTKLKELKADPSNLHNTSHKKARRRMMLNGKRPSECKYCWKVEDIPGDHFSDRVIKSTDTWAASRFEEVAKLDPALPINPSYLEVSFGNLCNFKCIYCMPHISSSIWSLYTQHGAYIGRESLTEIEAKGLRPFLPDEPNPYLEAFWNWFPGLSKDLRVFRITGGEPLINENTMKVLRHLHENPKPHLELYINSNFGIPVHFFRDHLASVKTLLEQGKIKNYAIYTSADTYGRHAEYIRGGMDFHRWKNYCIEYLEFLPTDLTIMVTFNLLSICNFEQLLDLILAMNKKYLRGNGKKRVFVDISHLTNPQKLAAWTLPQVWRSKLPRLAEFMLENSEEKIGGAGFSNYEIGKLNRIISWIDSHSSTNLHAKYFRGMFYLFTIQREQRESKKFLDYFPEMADFYQQAKEESESYSYRNNYTGENYSLNLLGEARDAKHRVP